MNKDILVSYDVTALFTYVPLDETINIVVNKAFTDDWFNKTNGLNLQKDQLTELLKIATTNQLFQFNGPLNPNPKLRSIFSRIDNPMGRTDSAINNLIFRNASASTAKRNADDRGTVRISLPFKDQVAPDAVRKQLGDRSRKILPRLQPVFVSKKLGQDLKPKEMKPSIVNRQCVVYRFSYDLCDADYVGYTARHLHQRIAEHKYSAIGRHFVEAHGSNHLLKENQFRVLRKYQGKFDCLVFEMLFTKNLKPNLNIQADPIRAALLLFFSNGLAFYHPLLFWCIYRECNL